MAIKKFNDFSEEDKIIVDREIQVLKLFKHPNIIKAKKIEFCNGKLYIVFEHMEMNLTQFIRQRSKDEIPAFIQQ